MDLTIRVWLSVAVFACLVWVIAGFASIGYVRMYRFRDAMLDGVVGLTCAATLVCLILSRS